MGTVDAHEVKVGVTMDGLHPIMQEAITVVNKIHLGFFKTPVIVTDAIADRSYFSYHPLGLAVDIRNRHISRPNMMYAFILEIRRSLGNDFDVVDEGDHIHIEYDVKEEKLDTTRDSNNARIDPVGGSNEDLGHEAGPRKTENRGNDLGNDSEEQSSRGGEGSNKTGVYKDKEDTSNNGILFHNLIAKASAIVRLVPWVDRCYLWLDRVEPWIPLDGGKERDRMEVCYWRRDYNTT